MLELRDYQRQALDQTYLWFTENRGSPLIVLPTGSGKSLVMAYLIKEALEKWPDQRLLIVTHVKELIRQNYEEMLRVWPSCPAGIYSAGIGRREHDAQVLFAGIQSVYDKPDLIGACDLVMIDEAHLISGHKNSMYRSFLDVVKAPCLGLTATHYRLDQGYLHEGDGSLFDGISYEANVGDLVDDKWLAPLISKATKTRISTQGVHSKGGDFIVSELAEAVRPATEDAVAEAVEKGRERRSWLLFGVTVDHCLDIQSALMGHGIVASSVFGDTPKLERDNLLQAFKDGHIQAMVSCGVLTTGFNAPSVDLLAMLRPTQSTGLYVQICGRGMRNAPDKKNCLVLDFAGNIFRHGPIDAVRPTRPSSDDDCEAPVKTCPGILPDGEVCGSIVHAAVRICPDCGFEFPKPEIKIDRTASNLAIMNSEMRPQWVAVDGVTYRCHTKKFSPNSMKVTYSCGLMTYREWICFEHIGYPKLLAQTWWKKRSNVAVPKSTSFALAYTQFLSIPTRICVRQNGKYFDVVDYDFKGRAA